MATVAKNYVLHRLEEERRIAAALCPPPEAKAIVEAWESAGRDLGIGGVEENKDWDEATRATVAVKGQGVAVVWTDVEPPTVLVELAPYIPKPEPLVLEFKDGKPWRHRWPAQAYGAALAMASKLRKGMGGARGPDVPRLQKQVNEAAIDTVLVPVATSQYWYYLHHNVLRRFVDKRVKKDMATHGHRAIDSQDLKDELQGVPSHQGLEPTLEIDLALMDETLTGFGALLPVTYTRKTGDIKPDEGVPEGISVAERTCFLIDAPLRAALLVLYDSYVKYLMRHLVPALEAAGQLDTVFPATEEEEKVDSMRRFNRASVLETRVLESSHARVHILARFTPLAYLEQEYGD